MSFEEPAGFREVEHTADWELEIWAPDLPSLLEQAALGMYTLAGVRLEQDILASRSFQLSFLDDEILLVEFLNELVWLIEDQELAFDNFVFTFEHNIIHVDLDGAKIKSMNKEIKAVTFHNINIQEQNRGLYVRVVFDV